MGERCYLCEELQNSLDERDAELQANLRCRESMQHTINRLEESEFHLKDEIQAHEKREAVLLAFVSLSIKEAARNYELFSEPWLDELERLSKEKPANS